MSDRTALLMPGQGSQSVGMGWDLAEAYPSVRALYERADDVLGLPLSEICWEGPEELLRRTENAQPAILTHSYAVWSVLPAEVRASVVVAAGHSLGEFSAYLAAGALEYDDALRVVRRRGELMAGSGDERPGGMAAIMGLDPEAVEELCASVEEGTVVAANFNAPGQIVISGDAAAVERAQELALDAGSRVIPLNVSGAFHSPLMEVAREGLREALQNVEIRDPSFPVVANTAAQAVTEATTARRYLVEQLTSPVRWVDGVGAMMAYEPTRWLEVGPGRVLAGLLRRIDRTQRAEAVGDPAALDALQAANSNGSGES